ncbi:glycine--tRNA ligase subunit beta [Erythrobacter neustonensis]|uniref:Glycine--tRNA ligase beta subunit n=1 Tax=Erythrobacter neustonensis TaxID=1112 RepID=A0A192D610_9SPHN|nr:glycine--tRNA ligase subunit beta [Erythrobacter neustonensis]ANK13535.1 glycine--tRNA ligase subunit beta [Erythrobacter neustonensis]
MANFLLELRCEEIPARMQAGARAELEKLFRRELDAAGVKVGELTIWSTPRRLALIARGLPLATEAVSEEAKGPPEGAPDAAIDGFCKKAGVTREQLELRDVKGRMTYFAVIAQPGRAMTDVLAAAIPAIIRDFSWPKSMRWGAASITTDALRWVRPLSGIVALLDGAVIDVEVGGIRSGATTRGHRFHHDGDITIASTGNYAEKLRAAHVIVDHEERAAIIREGAAKAAADAGLTLVADEGLVIENAGLTEWPVPLLGRFDEDFLDVPPEVIQLTARVNQKYFVCEDADGKLANAFVCTANIDPSDASVVVDGNRKVLAARLSDARFFWEQDQKTPLAQHAHKLARITFHEKLGTVADKVERVASLARWLCEQGIVAGDPALAEQAARLAKADLVTEMVGEFPELQGLMGGYYAAREGLPQEVSDAIRDHYKPVGQGDDVPTAPVTVAVSLADKLDTLRSFFAIDEKPTGSKDPFALRRAALAVIRLIAENDLRLGVAEGDLLDFFADRLKVQQREAGVRHDLIDAVFALGGEDDLVRLLARVHALQAFVTTEDGANLLAGYKRAANILKKEDWHGIEGEIAATGEEDPLAGVDDPDLAPVIAAKMADRHAAASTLSYTPEPAEKALIDALDTAAPRAAAAVDSERFADAMAALATLRAAVDRFFEEVTVNDADAGKRAARLALLARFRDAVHRVADFSRIEG